VGGWAFWGAVDRHPVVCVGVMGVLSKRALCEPCYKALIKHTCWAIPWPTPFPRHCGFCLCLFVVATTTQPPSHPHSPTRPLVQWLNPTCYTIQKGTKLPLIMMG